MLFRKHIEKNCAYCARGTVLEDDKILCSKRGLCSAGGGCRKFRYDPCKRVPPRAKPLDFSQYEDRDFSL